MKIFCTKEMISKEFFTLHAAKLRIETVLLLKCYYYEYRRNSHDK